MEEWNVGMLDKKFNHQNPLFHHSIIPIFQLFALRSLLRELRPAMKSTKDLTLNPFSAVMKKKVYDIS